MIFLFVIHTKWVIVLILIAWSKVIIFVILILSWWLIWTSCLICLIILWSEFFYFILLLVFNIGGFFNKFLIFIPIITRSINWRINFYFCLIKWWLFFIFQITCLLIPAIVWLLLWYWWTKSILIYRWFLFSPKKSSLFDLIKLLFKSIICWLFFILLLIIFILN